MASELQNIRFTRLNGIIDIKANDTARRTAQVITISNAQGTRAVPADEVEQLKITDVSVMPTGLLDSLSESEIRDLFGYMQKK